MSSKLLYLCWFKSYGCFSIFQIRHFFTPFFLLESLWQVSPSLAGKMEARSEEFWVFFFKDVKFLLFNAQNTHFFYLNT